MRKDELRLDDAIWSIQDERSKYDEQHLVPLLPIAPDLIRKALQVWSSIRTLE